VIRDGAFRKAGASEISDCVEVAALPQGGVRVRDSKDPGGPVVSYTDQEWRGFIQAIKGGEFESRP
jgi:hypothetical protein